MSVRASNIQELLTTRRPVERAVAVDAHVDKPANQDEFEHTPVGRVSRRPSMMLIIQKCTGEGEAFAYAHLRRVKFDNPDLGFVLMFGDTEVAIIGRNLTQTFHYVCEHRQLELFEADRVNQMNADHDARLIVEIRFRLAGIGKK